jgi:DNA topoisomerase-1
MSKNLVIVESPAKAKTIEGYLGADYTVKSSFGHIRDLAKKGLSVEIDNEFIPNYEVPAEKKPLITELKKLAKNAEFVWLATDEDREGEAISWHLFETLGLKQENTHRITFNEITKTAVQKAIANPRNNKPEEFLTELWGLNCLPFYGERLGQVYLQDVFSLLPLD